MSKEMESSINKLLNEIKEPINKLNDIQLQRLEMVKKSINDVISKNIFDKCKIEKILDELLDIAYWNYNEMLESFDKIINYYVKIDKKSANQYKKYLKDINKEV